MADACTLPRPALSGTIEPAPSLHRLITSLDLDGCHVHYIVMRMHEHEKATGVTFDCWPPSIQQRMNIEIEHFHKHHLGVDVKAVTHGVHEEFCTLALHWKVRK